MRWGSEPFSAEKGSDPDHAQRRGRIPSTGRALTPATESGRAGRWPASPTAGQRPALPSRDAQARQRFGLQPLIDLELVIHRHAQRLFEGLAVGMCGIGALFFTTQVRLEDAREGL
ncbi:hypothetical protein VM57_01570 [Stenotrophomonas maltophilia]|uniref:Uncharacterized protein n=1 Tax=Stenotrophomonas maltophilia TaxID=40324 RepID=A0A0F5ZPS8_STEMA|nr:hypothetical protein VM57_01570 [Stenotrophomonas maltophilia]